MMSAGLVDQQLSAFPWDSLRTGSGSGLDVQRELRDMLASEDDDVVRRAYKSIENRVTTQGHLSQCAPSVVSVILAGLTDESIRGPAVGPALDFLALILIGYSSEVEIELGETHLRQKAHAEALKGYWTLVRLANSKPDPWNVAGLASEILDILLNHPNDND